MAKLRLAPNLTLPVDAVTQTIAILAKRRVGKSYTARRFAEQLYQAGQQIVIVDPKGDWWGIRSSADGKGPGLPVVILGGERGDVPLEVGSGEVVAKLAAEERVSLLLDLSLFRKHEVATFMTAFLETLYRLKAREAFRTPLMLIVDEADAIMPQKPQENEARMLGAGEDIVRRGGQRGLGCMLITQRSAVLNKNVLTQAEMIVALRTIAPQDLKAMDAWIDVHGEAEQRETLMTSLPALPVGDAWFWSPGWPTADGIFQRVHVLPIETFDSGASPKAGEKRIEPKNLADVDLGALQKRMAETIEKAKASDPRLLRQRIAELERAAKAAPARTVEKVVVDDRAIARAVAADRREMKRRLALGARDLAGAVKSLHVAADAIKGASQAVTGAAQAVTAVGAALQTIADSTSEDSRAEVQVGNREQGTGANYPSDSAVGRMSRAPARPIATPRALAEGVTTGQQKILNALAELRALGIDMPRRQQLSLFAGMSLNGGSGAQNVADLVSMGLVEIPDKGLVRLTAAGVSAASAADAPSSLEELHGRVMAKITTGQQKILAHLLSLYPESIARAQLSEAVDMSLNGGSGAQNVADLVTLGAARIPAKGKVIASELLFPLGLS